MKTKIHSMLVAVALVAAGCSSVKTHVDTGPIAARTFSFIDPGYSTPPSSTDVKAQVLAMIKGAITTNLTAKGLSSVPGGGDVTVAFLVIAGNNGATTSLNDYFGYGPDASALLDKVHEEQAINDESRTYFQAGTLVIDIFNPRMSKLLKRASVKSPILQNATPDIRQARLQALVDEALGDLRIAK